MLYRDFILKGLLSIDHSSKFSIYNQRMSVEYGPYLLNLFLTNGPVLKIETPNRT